MTDQNHTPETAHDAPEQGVETTVAHDETTATAEQAAEDTSPEARIAALEAEVADFKDRWVRSEAEAQNVRNRAKRDVDDARQFAIQKFAKDVVEAADNIQRGIASLPPQAEDEDSLITKLREGFESTERSFLGILERNGITREDPTGKPFDANLHQAMAEQPSDEHEPGHVMQAWTPAWLLKGRLLKAAMVIVAKGAPSGDKATTGLDTSA
ncbi:heat shock protein GrpE [Neokomagataea thailandica NBRC 106555]|uniref:Protein GrpE n=2 Tax=Neokomagataea TaxID=1223423 RepID=A0A4Y6VBS6_9PROT|nr:MULTISPECIES: nucleotide exchange factor GrpE [Neokomagataea]QDH25917.1 nucleotide exchange factor GrpE [Neokomagataea tanensis]GBR51596.1 heat shock protein GrpE [Neokomagataea thailandica NBRC 106555]